MQEKRLKMSGLLVLRIRGCHPDLFKKCLKQTKFVRPDVNTIKEKSKLAQEKFLCLCSFNSGGRIIKN